MFSEEALALLLDDLQTRLLAIAFGHQFGHLALALGGELRAALVEHTLHLSFELDHLLPPRLLCELLEALVLCELRQHLQPAVNFSHVKSKHSRASEYSYAVMIQTYE